MTKQASLKPKDPELQNEGEGSRSAARRYDAGAERAAGDKEKTDKLAKEAQQALSGPEKQSLLAAEKHGKKAKHR
jgi:hypothetical protein